MRKIISTFFFAIILFVLASFIYPAKVSAHCDALDGPVVKAAQKALDTNNANYVFVWVKPENESEIKKALKRAQNKRKKARTRQEKERAEMEFYEILVRVHREGEGAKYEGIKPAGSIEPEIALADKAIETGKIGKVLAKISSGKSKEIVKHLFLKAIERSDYEINDVPAGRKFIEVYVQFIHTVEKAVKGMTLQENKLHDH